MSSFINKSGKKVAPKGAPRRRAGGPPAAAPAAPQPSIQPVLEKPQETLQPEVAVPSSNSQAQLHAPNATRIEKPPTPSAPVISRSLQPIGSGVIESDPAPSIQSSSIEQFIPQVPSHEINAPKEPVARSTPERPQPVAETPTVIAPSSTRRRSASPLTAKHQRVEEVVDAVHAPSTAIQSDRPPARPLEILSHHVPLPEIGRAPVAVMLPGPVVSPISKPSIAGDRMRRDAKTVSHVEISDSRPVQQAIPGQTTFDQLNGPPVNQASSQPVQSDTPNIERVVPSGTPPAVSGQVSQPLSGRRSARAARPAKSAGATSPLETWPTPRAKRARKDQWQVSTPTDVTIGKGKRNPRKLADRIQIERQQEIENDDELNQPSVVTLMPAVFDELAAPAKARKVRKDKGVKRLSKASQNEAITGSIETRIGGVNEGPAGSDTQADEPATEDQNNPAPISEAAQKRLANTQKRKAKQMAKSAALSKARGRADAAIIDNAVAKSVEGRAGSSSRAKRGPTFIATPGTPDHEGTVATSRASVATTETTEGGTVSHRKKRQKRAETPEENETVFIVESKTSMFDLAGRDTENRVGLKSEREKAMRLINWDEVKAKRKAEDERMARMARGKRNREDDYDPEEEGMDEDQRLARAVARNKHKRPGLQITLMANGEHVIDEQSQMVDRQRLNEDELELLEEVEEDDLTKKFNVQTYGLWRRKEEEERIPHNERWTFDQTEKFYDALTSFGTDFMIISTMFPGMTRRQIKAKFVREERAEPERIRDALTGHNSGRRNGVERSGWDLKVYCEGAGLSESAFLDPKKIHEELERDRSEREKEIEEARAEAAEEDRQRRLAGALNGDDEIGSDGEPLSPGAVVQRAREEARKKKLARLGEKKRKILEMAGGSEEVVESIEDD